MMSTKTLSAMAEDYFYNINPLAKRISEDVAATKDAYEGLWNTLSLEERNQALDETIIQPEVALKYASKQLESSKDFPEYYPKLRLQTGMKYIIDETGSTLRWKDEHSAPFSFMTQSQMNLDCLDQTNDKNKIMLSYISNTSHYTNPCSLRTTDDSLDDNYSSPSSHSFYQTENYSDTLISTEECSTIRSSCVDTETSDGMFAKSLNKDSLIKLQNNSSEEDIENLRSRKNLKQVLQSSGSDKSHPNTNMDEHLKSSDIESTALLDTPNSCSSYQSSQLNQDPEIPKTGFEFLDNW
ncbi:PREDICTED: uncharacterized protein LOC105365348 [Ceratosolen solmsi marchali]|uniref:Uncharacterized protein LOC105365348 n=1 Tax=Ceratosolen solmsi marchali TaxID=326594 RepID=A0AAJ6YPG6_9HYME|nr:PREDICTED: uncharacterized protein LOC105365348 [Ceratosolen solmsi marchali]